MKFSCDRCQTRYSIGDEKVRGKILKIRCKTCGNIIVVRESTGVQQTGAVAAQGGTGGGAAYHAPSPNAAGGSPGAAGPPPPVPSRAQQRSDVEWFVAIKGKQHGPAKAEDVARLFHEGKITARTYLWHEGMGAWTRLQEVPELAGLLSEPAGKRPAPPPPPPSDEGAEIVNFEAARLQRLQQQGAAPASHDPFAAVIANAPGIDPSAPRDSTRVFIMQAGLANRGKKHRMYALGAGVAGLALFGLMTLDYQGVIEIPGLHRVMNVVTQRNDAPPVIQTVAWETGDEDPELKCKLFPNPEECKKQVAAANVERRKKRAAASKSGGVAGLSDAELNAAFGGGAPGADPNLKSAGRLTDEFAGTSNDAEAQRIASMFNDGRGGPKTPTSRMETPSVAGSNLDGENVASVVKNGAASVQACVEREAKAGNVPGGKQRLVLTVQPKGIVESARFENGAVSASPVGECIRGAAKKWKFAPFVGEATDIEIPLILSVTM